VSANEDTCECIAFSLCIVVRRMLVVGSRPFGKTCRSCPQRSYLPRRTRAGNIPPEMLLGFVCFCTCSYVRELTVRDSVVGIATGYGLEVLDSVVGIATGYGLEGPGIESPWCARFCATVLTGPGAHSASYTRGKATGVWR
jgi:hypothetical protein